MRESFIGWIINSAFCLLLSSLFFIQILQFPYYRRLSRNNSIRVLPLEAPRGNIYDRNGALLVSNRLSFDAAIVYQEISNSGKVAHALKNSLGMTGVEIAEAFEKASARPFVPVTIAEDIGKDRAIVLEEAALDTPGVVINTKSRRNYIHNYMGSHMFGYLTEVTEQELDNLKDYGYRMKDLIGRAGIEKFYNEYLTGVAGGTQIEVDNRGRQTRVLGFKEPASGRDLRLTVDMKMQDECEKLLGEHKGAVIVMNPYTGEILSLVSHPAFDPNIFVMPKSSRDRVKLIRDRVGRPLSNRAISGIYPPGSVFKMVTASAALETNKISRWTSFFCPGSYRLGRAVFRCWKEEGHGSQNLKGGLMNSCDVFFYNTGRLAGVDSIERYARMYGYGRMTGIDLPDEVKGIVPGKGWKRQNRGAAWYEGDTVNYSIGQGYLAVTPIQVLEMTAACANGGSLVKPYIVKRIGTTEIINDRLKPIGVKNGTLKIIKEGMYEVVNNENGTGKRAKVEGLKVAGKTGTAENPHGRTHAWFTGFAPLDSPRVCAVVFLEHGGKGGVAAAEITRGIFEKARELGYL